MLDPCFRVPLPPVIQDFETVLEGEFARIDEVRCKRSVTMTGCCWFGVTPGICHVPEYGLESDQGLPPVFFHVLFRRAMDVEEMPCRISG